MGLGIKSLIKYLIQIRKEEKLVPIEHRPTSGHEFENKVALVTGESGGIGFAIAETLLESGCKVIISGTKVEKLGGIGALTFTECIKSCHRL